MPLPDIDSPWPPRTVADVYADMAEADVWYTGDRAALAAYYGDTAHRASASDRLWTRPRHLGERERRLHIPLAGDIAATSADLLFSEPPQFAVTDTATQARLTDLVDDGGVHQRLLEAAELAAALGDGYLALAWDRDVIPDRPILTARAGDTAIPTFRFDRLTEVTFWRELDRSDNRVIRLLEHHGVQGAHGYIHYGLFEGTPDNLGRPLPLESHPDSLPHAMHPDGRQATGIPLLTATHIPNMRPNRKHRGSHGRSDYAAPIYGQFDALDETWTSWQRDIRLARARLIVPRGYLRSAGPGEGATFDADREVWDEIDADPNTLGAGSITANQFAIRVAEHQATADATVAQAVSSAGYSPATFALRADAGAQTATEIVSRERRSMITRDRKSRYWQPALRRIVEAMLLLDNVQFGTSNVVEPPTVTFGDAVSEDPESAARTLQMLDAARAISVQTKVEIQHPDWEPSDVLAEVERILDENNMRPIELESPDTFKGGPFGTPPNDDEDESAGKDDAEDADAEAA
jgi:A118 family predicted phage portal protein